MTFMKILPCGFRIIRKKIYPCIIGFCLLALVIFNSDQDLLFGNSVKVVDGPCAIVDPFVPNETKHWAWQPETTWDSHFDQLFASKRFTLRQSKIDEEICKNKTFERSVMKNAAKIARYRFDVSNDVEKYLCLDESCFNSIAEENSGHNTQFPVIVTGSSSNHFGEAQAFFESVHKIFMADPHSKVKVIFYDLGLTHKQRQLLQKYCRCEYRVFPREKFPEFTHNNWFYGWKPAIIQMVLREFDLVMWADSSVRFYEADINRHVKDAQNVGIQLMTGDGNIAKRTNFRTFKYLEEQPCLYRDAEIQAGFLLIHRNPFVMKYIIKPWVSCAMTNFCMIFPGCLFYRGCVLKKEYFQCHRFDQSVLGIILTRLFNTRRDLVHFYRPSFAKIQWENVSKYFENLKEKH